MEVRLPFDFSKTLLQIIFYLLQYGFAFSQDSDCDYFQNVLAGQTHYVYSKNYPGYYPQTTTCRWQATCPANTRCHISCNLEIPYTEGCEGDRVLISKTGDSLLTGAERYCGTGTLEATSTSNSLAIGFVSYYSFGGRFICTLTSVDSGETTPPCECGWQKQTRIVGGEETEVNEFPLMAGLVDYNRRVISCGSTIIHNRWVITAAHCLDSFTVSDLGVLVGEHNIATGSETNSADLIPSERFIQHSQYTQNQFDYDIALVRTARDIVFSDEVGPACLPFVQAAQSFDGVDIQAIGWGTTSFAGTPSDYLQKVTLKVISLESCRNSLGSVINERKLCTFESGKDACQFDSGGPLIWQGDTNSRYYLLGIISLGYGCATSRPAPNTRVSEYLQWIRDNTPDAEYCSI